MTKLAAIEKKLISIPKKCTKTEKIEFLHKNIELFRKVTNLENEVHSALPEELFKLNKILFRVAQNFISYAYAVKDTQNENNVLSYIGEASACYKLICDSIGNFPPFNLPGALTDQSLNGEFYLLKSQYHIALLNLYFINKNQVSASEESLNNIIQTLEAFKFELEERYRKFEKQFKTKALLKQIEKALINAKGLLARQQLPQTDSSAESPRPNLSLPLKKRKPVQDEASCSTSSTKTNPSASKSEKSKKPAPSSSKSETKQNSKKNSKQVNTKRKRVRKEKASEQNKGLTHSKSSKPEPKQLSQETSKPVRAKRRRIIIEKDEASQTELNTDTSLLQAIATDAANAARLPVPAKVSMLAQPTTFDAPTYAEQEATVLQQFVAPPIEEMASTSYLPPTTSTSISFSIEQRVASEPTITTPATTVNSPQGFWTVSTRTQDLKEALQAWEAAYFKNKEAGASAKKSCALEKLAHALLLEAGELQKNNGDWSGLNTNPAIIIAVHLLVKSAEANPSYQSETGFALGLQNLSKRYAAQLKPFLPTSHDKNEIYLFDLINEFWNEEKPNLHAISVAQITERVFLQLNDYLTETDYQSVHNGCLNSIKQATKRKNGEIMQPQSTSEEQESIGLNV